MNETLGLIHLNSSSIKPIVSRGIHCPILTQHEIEIFETARYWLGSVGICCIAIPGLLLNVIAIYVLVVYSTRKNIFTKLIVSLFVFDTIYLVLKLLGMFVVQFQLGSPELLALGGKLTYPLLHISLTASIFMTVGIAHERYVAIVRNPIVHRQSMESAKFRRKHIMYYVLPIVICSIAFNCPKFFEGDVGGMESFTANNSFTGNRYVS